MTSDAKQDAPEGPEAYARALAAEHERLVAALSASRCGTWRWELATNRVDWDEALSRVFGIPHSESPRTSEAFFALVHPDDRDHASAALSACMDGGPAADYEYRAVIGDSERWIYNRSSVVRDANGTPLHMTGACLDITDRKRIEHSLNDALLQQKLLLRELNHRVKNHLQMVIAMLRLKASRQENASARDDFQRAIGRIETIADLHGRLYRDDQVHAVDVDSYLADVCDNLAGSILPDTGIIIDREVQPLEISLDQAVPIGLIVNELITNAGKYAFRDRPDGRILVRLRAWDGRVTLAVADNGRGIPPGSNPGVGTRMVHGLAAQIDGRLKVKTSRHGTAYFLSFHAYDSGQP